MVIEYDEKGKFYTDIITKDMILSHIQTHTHQIRGNVHVRKGDRLSDEINNANVFLAVTNAEIFSLLGESLYTCKFLIVNRSHIVWLMPIDEQQENVKQSGEN
ncbi:MAG: hypothetical protein A2Z71_09310 [Chloroflexi bacterium RBG_13_50_21]|nr:MAG: hypothetical protein A2Z71_09310 [Chloroflexi bacterium RBG_13_50_21]